MQQVDPPPTKRPTKAFHHQHTDPALLKTCTCNNVAYCRPYRVAHIDPLGVYSPGLPGHVWVWPSVCVVCDLDTTFALQMLFTVFFARFRLILRYWSRVVVHGWWLLKIRFFVGIFIDVFQNLKERDELFE